MTSLLASCYFAGHQTDQWARLGRVLEMTAARHCGTWEHRIERLSPAGFDPRENPTSIANTRKLEWWRDVVRNAEDGRCIVLLDADTFIAGPLDELWDIPFDMMITDRYVAKYSINGGVIAVRATKATRDLFDAWVQTNRKMLTDPDLHLKWRAKYGGLNQAALGCVLESSDQGETFGAGVVRLPAVVWNACDTATWAAFGPETKIVHVKSELRIAVLQGWAGVPQGCNKVVDHWKKLERELKKGVR